MGVFYVMCVAIGCLGQLQGSPMNQGEQTDMGDLASEQGAGQGTPSRNYWSNMKPCMVVNAASGDTLFSEKCWFQTESCEEQAAVSGSCIGYQGEVRLYYCKDKPPQALDGACEICDDIIEGEVQWTEQQRARNRTCDLDHYILVSNKDHREEQLAVAYYRDNCNGVNEESGSNGAPSGLGQFRVDPHSCCQATGPFADGPWNWNWGFLWDWVWNTNQGQGQGQGQGGQGQGGNGNEQEDEDLDLGIDKNDANKNLEIDEEEGVERVEGRSTGSDGVVEIDLLRLDGDNNNNDFVDVNNGCGSGPDAHWCGDFSVEMYYYDYYYCDHCCNRCVVAGAEC